MRTICVSGAASGIGNALRKRLEADGCEVIGVDLRDAEVIADLGTVVGRAAAVQAVQDACGGRLDGLAALAGVGPHVGVVPQITVNYFGAVALLEGLRPALFAGESPAALVASSIAATVAPCDDDVLAAIAAADEPGAVEAAVRMGDAGVGYSTSKRALALYVRRNAPAWVAEGVRLNALAPGNTVTPLTEGTIADPDLGPAMQAVPVPRGAWAEPSEIAPAAAWALSPEASYLVGSFFVVDGGTDALVRPDSF